jgi:hypothetical protein
VITEEDFADVALDTVQEWLKYFYPNPGAMQQYKAERIDASDVPGVGVFRVSNLDAGTYQEFELTITAKEL